MPENLGLFIYLGAFLWVAAGVAIAEATDRVLLVVSILYGVPCALILAYLMFS